MKYIPKIIENDDGTTSIDGFVFEGGFDRTFACPECGDTEMMMYYDDYDAHFCASCNIWLERNCGDKNCQFCANRPDRPLPWGA